VKITEDASIEVIELLINEIQKVTD
jgi:hypothetical protein